MPDRRQYEERQVDDDEDRREGAGVEMMRDLYRQIQEVEPRGTPEEDLAAAMDAAADKLLSASARAARDQVAPLGLDVIVVAHPTGREVIGLLDLMMTAGMEKLDNKQNLVRAVQGSEALSFLEILDFDHYWDRSPEGLRIREAVRNSVERWQSKREQRQPAFGRCYLVDGHTRDGVRDTRHRLDEISLFLEFLLFEDQRGTFQRLYQSAGARESPVATFGVRLMERSAGLLSRLAAARFGIGWLDYLAGTEALPEDDATLAVREHLRSYRPANLDRLLHREALEGLLGQEMQSLEQDLLALEPEDPDWPERVRRQYRSRVQSLRARLSGGASTRMVEVSQEHLAGLDVELRAGIDADLHNPQRPVPLGTVIDELEDTLKDLDVAGEALPEATAEAGETFRELERLHADYRAFNSQRVEVEGLKKWWLLFALVLAAALTPIGVELLDDIPPPDDTAFLLKYAYQAVQWIKNPVAVGLIMFLGCWALGAGAMQRRVAARVDRARRFFNDPERGRFTGRLRGDLGPGGPLRRPLESFLAALLHNLSLSVRSEVSRELGRALGRLRERRREVRWLREQLREFLRMQGLSMDGRRHELHRRGGTGIRHSVERDEDFEQMLKSNPPGLARFRSIQGTLNPFALWDQRYGRDLLFPMAFIDRLSRIYRDPFQRELARPGSGPEQETRAREFLSFLRRHGNFGLAFSWQAQEGVPLDQRYCLLPTVWHHLPGVRSQLSDLRMGENHVLDGQDVARAYLLRIQTGVEPDCLVEAR